MSGEERQLTFDLLHAPAFDRADFLLSASNEIAFHSMSDWTRWPEGRLALVGSEGSGKSHLAAIWQAATGAALSVAAGLTESRLRLLMQERAIIVEDVHEIADLPGPARRQAEEVLFHLWNHAGNAEVHLLLTGREAPSRWRVDTPDLASRLASVAVVDIQPPDDALLSSVLVKLFADRQLLVAPDVIEFLARRIERSFAAAEAAVAELDRKALVERRKITRPFAARLFQDGG